MRRTQSVPPLYQPHAHARKKKTPMKSLQGLFFIKESANSQKRMLVQFKADQHNLNVYLVQRFLKEQHYFCVCKLTLDNTLVVVQNGQGNHTFWIAAWLENSIWNEIFCMPLDLEADLWRQFLRTRGVRCVLKSSLAPWRFNYHLTMCIMRSSSLPSVTEHAESDLSQD